MGGGGGDVVPYSGVGQSGLGEEGVSQSLSQVCKLKSEEILRGDERRRRTSRAHQQTKLTRPTVWDMLRGAARG